MAAGGQDAGGQKNKHADETDGHKEQNVADEIQPGSRCLHRLYREVAECEHRADSDQVEDIGQNIVVQSRNGTLRVDEQNQDKDNAVHEEQVTAKFFVSKGDQNLDADSGDDQCLVIGEADAEDEESPIEVAQSRGLIDPAQKEHQDAHDGEHTQGIDLDDDRLAPEKAIESHEHAGDIAGDAA